MLGFIPRGVNCQSGQSELAPWTPSISLTMTLSHVDLVVIDQNKWPLSKHSSPEEQALRTLPCAIQCGVLKIKMMMEVESDQEQRTNPVSGICPCLSSVERARWDLFQYHLKPYPRGKGSTGSYQGSQASQGGKRPPRPPVSLLL